MRWLVYLIYNQAFVRYVARHKNGLSENHYRLRGEVKAHFYIHKQMY